MEEPTISQEVAARLVLQFGDSGMAIVQADNGEFLVKNKGISDDGTALDLFVFARITE